MALLDTLSGTTFVAYSMGRLLRTAYVGSAFKVRRTSDSTTLDIGFVAGNTNTAGLLTFCAATNGTCRTLYDQKSTKDMVFSGGFTECTIVTSGALDTPFNGWPTLKGGGYLTNASAAFPSTNTHMMLCTVASASPATHTFDKDLFTFLATGQANPFGNVLSFVGFANTRKGGVEGFRNSLDLSYGNTPRAVQFQASSIWDGTNHTMRVNGHNQASVAQTGTFGTTGATGLMYEAGGASKTWEGQCAEMIIGDFTAGDITLIEASQMAFWGAQSYAQLGMLGVL